MKSAGLPLQSGIIDLTETVFCNFLLLAGHPPQKYVKVNQ